MRLKKKKRPYVCAVIVAAGSASRMNGVDKQLAEIDGIPVVMRSVLAFEQSALVDEIVIVTKKESIPELSRQARGFGADKVRCIVAGGATRQESVANGVNCADALCEYVAIHDGARPLVLTGAIDACIEAAVEHGAAMLGVSVKDTIKAVDSRRFIERTLNRENLVITQTPQIFSLPLYRSAMDAAQKSGENYTDDCQLVEAAGHPVYVCAGHYSNIKITTPDDIFFAEALLGQMGEPYENWTRV